MKKVFLILFGIVGVLLFASVRLLNISVVDNKTSQIDYSNLSNDDLLANAFKEIQIGNLEKSYSCSRLLQEREPNNINSYLMMSIAYRLKHNLPMSLAVLESAEKTITESTDIHDQFELLFLRSLAYK